MPNPFPHILDVPAKRPPRRHSRLMPGKTEVMLFCAVALLYAMA